MGNYKNAMTSMTSIGVEISEEKQAVRTPRLWENMSKFNVDDSHGIGNAAPRAAWRGEMGNHDVGRAMGAAARGFWAGNGDAPVTQEKALAVLDAAGEMFRGADAEFDDELFPDEPLGKLVRIAFGPWTDEQQSTDTDGEGWYETIECPFHKRYDFC